MGRRHRRGGMPRTVQLAATLEKPALKAPSAGHVVGGKYRIDGLIGQGGMGVVYSATHLVSDKRVAIKWMLPAPGASEELAERFVREARATARIDHPNVVDIYDVGVEEGSMFLVMERLHGESLAQRLDSGALEPTEAVALLMPALRAVSAAHAQGVIHRDLKPDNIFLCVGPDGEPREPKVLDFGISKIAAGERHDFSLTQSGTIMGTPLYMSPEQVRGLRDVDARGDVYAFGVILYEMLTGAFPFDAETYNELIVKIATEDPTPITTLLPDLDLALVEVIGRAMARSRDARYASVAELAAALEPFAGGVTFRRLSSASGNQLPVFSQRVPRGSGSGPTRGAGRGLEETFSARPTEQAETPSALRAAPIAAEPVVGMPVTAAANQSASRRVLVPLLGLCVVAALVAFVWLRFAGDAGEPSRAAKARPLPVRTSAPMTAAAPPETEPGAEARPGAAADLPAGLPSGLPSGISAPGEGAALPEPATAEAPQPATQPRATHKTAHARRAAETPAPVSAATPAKGAREEKAQGLPADWDERLGRSPAAAPAAASSPRHAGTLSADDL